MVYLSVVLLEERNIDCFRMFRFLFTRDSSLLILRWKGSHQVFLWRALYALYVYLVASAVLIAITFYLAAL